MKRRNYIFLFCLLLLASCKRESYELPVEADPIFVLKGTLDGAAYSLAAGKENIYMNSAMNQNSFGVYEFTSQFIDLSCVGCEPVLSFKINNTSMQDQGEQPDLNVFTSDHLEFANQPNNSDYLTLHFHADFVEGSSCSWNFGDGQTGFGHSPDHTYESAGTYSVVLSIDEDGDENDVTITQTVVVGSPMLGALAFNMTNLPNDEWEFSFPQSLPSYLEVTGWTINGGEYIGNHLHVNLQDEVDVCLHYVNTVSNEEGSYCLHFNANSYQNESALFNYQWNAQDLNLGKVEMKYRSGSGSVYNSFTNLNAGPNESFEFISMEDYPDGINGKSAKQVQVKFSLYMVNDDDPNDVIHFENVTAQLGFAVE